MNEQEAVEQLAERIYSRSNPNANGCLIFDGSLINGYGSIVVPKALREFGWPKKTATHRAVCWATHGPPSDRKLKARHQCHVRACCEPRHLRWGTTMDNITDSRLSGQRMGISKLTRDQAGEIRLAYAKGVSGTKLANLYGVCAQTIYRLVNGQTWAWCLDDIAPRNIPSALLDPAEKLRLFAPECPPGADPDRHAIAWVFRHSVKWHIPAHEALGRLLDEEIVVRSVPPDLPPEIISQTAEELGIDYWDAYALFAVPRDQIIRAAVA